MPGVHQVVFSEEFPTGPFHGICMLRLSNIVQLVLRQTKNLPYNTPSPHFVFSAPQTHKTPMVKQELPSPPAAPSSSLPSLTFESSDGEEWRDEDKKEKEKTEKTKTPSGWKCAPCHARYPDREDYITHMAEQHGKVWKSTIPLLSQDV